MGELYRNFKGLKTAEIAPSVPFEGEQNPPPSLGSYCSFDYIVAVLSVFPRGKET